MGDYERSELIIKDIGDDMGAIHGPWNETLEQCKRYIGADYCRMCIREALLSTKDSIAVDHYLRKVAAMFESGIWPHAVIEKIRYGENSFLYLATLQLLNGSLTEAATTLRPYMKISIELIETRSGFIAGLRVLSMCLMTSNQVEHGLALARRYHADNEWGCDGCGSRISFPNDAAFCRYRSEVFCGPSQKLMN